MSTKELDTVEFKEYFDQFRQLDKYRPSATILVKMTSNHVGIILQTSDLFPKHNRDLRSVHFACTL